MTFNLRSLGLWVVAGGLSLGVGCGPSKNAVTTGPAGVVEATDPWPKFVAALRNNPDPVATRAAVADLTAGLNNAPPDDRPKAADPEYLSAVTAGLRLTETENRYVAGSEFTPLDANYLSESLYLADVTAGLGVLSTDPPAVQADAAFRFVVRQVVLAPSILGSGMLPPVPPTYVLSRGWGTGLERAGTFIALCRQLELDAYLIGPPEAADRSWTFQGNAADGQPPKGAFWAVGVRTPDGVLLFDPFRGEAVPGKAADRPITLAELKADPAACPWTAEGPNAWDVTADDIKAAGLFLSPPLPAVAPRMRLLQTKLNDSVGVRLAVEWTAAVTAAEAVADGAKVQGWNPPTDKFTPVRVLGSFLPREQGGVDPTPPQSPESVYSQFQLAQLPIDRLQRLPIGLSNRQAQEKLTELSAILYREAFLVAPTPRERLQRGQYKTAVSELVNERDRFANLLEESSANDEALKDWYRSLSGVFNRVTQTLGTPDEENARNGANKYLQQSGRMLEKAIGGMVAEAGLGEASYLLALVAHEQAEAAEAAAVRAERNGDGAVARKAAKALWEKAANGWNRYSQYADLQEASFPGRKATFAALSARAAKLK